MHRLLSGWPACLCSSQVTSTWAFLTRTALYTYTICSLTLPCNVGLCATKARVQHAVDTSFSLTFSPVSHLSSTAQESSTWHSSHAVTASSMETSHWPGSPCAHASRVFLHFPRVVRDLNATGVFRGRLWSPSAFHSTLNLIHKKQHHWQRQKWKGEGGIAPAFCRKHHQNINESAGSVYRTGWVQVCTCILNRRWKR